MSLALIGVRFSSKSLIIGIEPMAAARWSGSMLRLSFVRVEALCAINFFAVSRLFLDAAKCSAVCPPFAIHVLAFEIHAAYEL